MVCAIPCSQGKWPSAVLELCTTVHHVGPVPMPAVHHVGPVPMLYIM
jgi:hypothetical protein